MKFLSPKGLATLIEKLSAEYDVYGPREVGGRLGLAPLTSNGRAPEVVWNDYRLPESWKPVFLQSGRVLSRWTRDGPREGTVPRARAIVGAKACDLRALGILDKVLRDHDYQEPAWCEARKKNLVISGDCTAFASSCFCTMLGDEPYPTSLFDLNLSPAGRGGYVVETGSPEGEALVERHAGLFREATEDEVAARDETRCEITAGVKKQNAPFPTKDPFELSVEKNLKTRLWGQLAATCVECNACNMACPTCHCFVLHDVKTDDGAVRISLWDSCFHAGYARMAGGGTPRLQLTERFKNHYYHKFVSFPRNWGVTACTGCGRCIDACMGRIDKRACLHRLETEWIPSEVLEEVE